MFLPIENIKLIEIKAKPNLSYTLEYLNKYLFIIYLINFKEGWI